MRGFLLFVMVTFLLVSVLVVAVGISFVRFYVVPSTWMEPGLLKGDSLVGIRLIGQNLTRGELVAFNLPYDPTQSAIGRVLGLPGDRVRVENGRVVLNGKTLDEPYIELAANVPSRNFPDRFDSSLDQGEVLRLQSEMYAEWVKEGNLIVPEGMYFILNDNRNGTVDSRNYGPVPQANIVAKPIYVYATKAAGSSRRRIDEYVVGLQPQ